MLERTYEGEFMGNKMSIHKFVFAAVISASLLWPTDSAPFGEAVKLYQQYVQMQKNINARKTYSDPIANKPSLQLLDQAENQIRKLDLSEKNYKNLDLLAAILRDQCTVFSLVREYKKAIEKCEAYANLNPAFETEISVHVALYLAYLETRDKTNSAKHLLRSAALKFKEDTPEYNHVLERKQNGNFDKNTFHDLREMGDDFSNFVFILAMENLKSAKSRFAKCKEEGRRHCRNDALNFIDRGLTELAQMRNLSHLAKKVTKDLIAEYAQFYENEINVAYKIADRQPQEDESKWKQLNALGAPNVELRIQEKLRRLSGR